MTPDLKARVNSVELLVLDVDGVLTDGSVNLTASGEEIKSFHVRDGLGIKSWQKAGGKVAIISGRSSPAVNFRAKELGIDLIYQGVSRKWSVLEQILQELRLHASQVVAIGDDLADLQLIVGCGVGIAVADAVEEVRINAHFVTKTPGGRGAVREAIEWLLKTRGHWSEIIAHHRDEANPSGAT